MITGLVAMSDLRVILSIVLVASVQVLEAISVKSAYHQTLREDRASLIRPDHPNEVLSLPGYEGPLPSKHYAGYFTVDKDHGRHLYYYLVTSESNTPDHDPLIIWLTGGPGCSSMDAFTYEHGPFNFRIRTAAAAAAAGTSSGSSGSGSGSGSSSIEGIQLTRNPYSWSRAANILYIDSPAGTGMSYSESKRDYVTDDSKTIDDLEIFVTRFFEDYSELEDLDLYIAGESYGGVYVPLLTQRLLQHNNKLAAAAAAAKDSSSSSRDQQPYNLVGYIIGNPVTDDSYDYNGQIEFAYGLGLIDPVTYNKARHVCKSSSWNVASGSPCDNELNQLEQIMGNINHYDILGTCYLPQQQQQDMQQQQHRELYQGANKAQRMQWRYRQQFNQAADSFQHSSSSGSSSSSVLGHTVSCGDRHLALKYYNNPAVRQAIHAASLDTAGRWEPCSDIISYSHTQGSMIPVHEHLLSASASASAAAAAGLRALVLSGDHDYVVPFTGTRSWVFDIKMKQKKGWHAWSIPGSQQVSGYAVEFSTGLTFATVKGAGHMVPQTNPQEALALLQLWLNEEL